MQTTAQLTLPGFRDDVAALPEQSSAPPKEPPSTAPDISDLHVDAARASSRDLCHTGTTVGVNRQTRTAYLIPLRCKTWACKKCAPLKVFSWTQIALSGDPQRFITLSCDPARFQDPSTARAAMQKGFTELVRRIRNKCGRFEYLRIWELHKNGYPHFHILQRGDFIPQEWLSEQWDAVGGGPIVDIRKIRQPEKTAKYCFKYLAKGLSRLALEWPRTRLIVKSKGWIIQPDRVKPPPLDDDAQWFFVKRPLWQILSDLADCGVVRRRYSPYSDTFHLDLARAHKPKFGIPDYFPLPLGALVARPPPGPPST